MKIFRAGEMKNVRTGLGWTRRSLIPLGLVAFASAWGQGSKEWPTYGHDPGGMRFSPLTQLTPENVAKLKVAWVYHMRPPVVPGATPAPAPVAIATASQS